MTDEQHAYWSKYVEHMASLLGLRDWRITLEREPSEDDCAASIACIYGRKAANIRLMSEWETYGNDRKRQTVIHELLHCHTRDMQDTAESTIGLLGSPAYSIFSSRHEQSLELCVDGIAEAIAPFFPLPEAA